MSSTRLPPSREFNFSKPDEWPKCQRRFEQYRSASGLNAEPDARQIDTLLYCLGGEADSVLVLANIPEENWKKYVKVMTKFDSAAFLGTLTSGSTQDPWIVDLVVRATQSPSNLIQEPRSLPLLTRVTEAWESWN